MKKMTLNSRKKCSETSVSNFFLDHYMKDAHGDFVKVYLYLLRCMNDDSVESLIGVSQIADALNLIESDVLRALKYWNKLNVISVEFDSDTKEPSSITFNSFDDIDACACKAEDTNNEAIPVKEEASGNEQPSEDISDSKPSVSAAKLNRLREQEDVKQFLYVFERYCGPLSSTDVRSVIGIYDTYGFSGELMEYLVEYCATHERGKVRYIMTVADDWFKKGITSPAEAKAYTKNTNRIIKVVASAFGIKDRSLTKAEMEFITKWCEEYKFSDEIIEEACKRTIISMGRANFNYAGGILGKWFEGGVHTLSDIATLDKNFRGSVTVRATTSAPARTSTRITNFTQRNYDFDALEKKLLSHSKK